MDRSRISVLLWGLSVILAAPANEASSLGMTVHVVPLDRDGGKMVRAHFSIIVRGPCPDVSGVCAAGEDCLIHTTSSPFTGTRPNPGWCVRQWQKTVPSKYNALMSLGSSTELFVSLNAGPKIRENSGKLNRPPFVGLPPPLRARVNCPHHFELAVRDLDGDKVRCRFARYDQGECLNCIQHSFIELDQLNCILSFTGKAPEGQYFIYLMVEDLIPAPQMRYMIDSTPLSSVPVHLSITVEESDTRCSEEPVASVETPKDKSELFVLPYQEVKFTVNYASQLESVEELAVVGPPELYRIGFTLLGPFARLTIAWIRSESNTLAQLLPICFVTNTKSVQSEPRCVWLYQRESKTLPAGTVLKCEKTQMTLVLPVTSLPNINLTQLQLNSATCPVIYNSTHLSARISLTDCGTKTVHAGSELVFTNTLHSVRPYTTISREPSLILPLACRIPRTQVQGPQFTVNLPSESEAFGEFRLWLEFHLPGQGPLAKFTSSPKLRSNFSPQRRTRREAKSETKSEIIFLQSSNRTRSFTDGITLSSNSKTRIGQLDLHVMSNSSVEEAELVVISCAESETDNMKDSHSFLEKGCMMSNSTLEIVTDQKNVKIYRLDLNEMLTSGPMMYVQCVVNLCIATMPSQTCPDLCNGTVSDSDLVDSVFTSSYTLRSGPVSLEVNASPSPLSTLATTTPNQSATSHAPKQTSFMVTGVILATMSMSLLKIY